MRDTVMPLSIAFYAADGSFVSAADMEPCLTGPDAACARYAAAGALRHAIEVPEGGLAALLMVDPRSRLDACPRRGAARHRARLAGLARESLGSLSHPLVMLRSVNGCPPIHSPGHIRPAPSRGPGLALRPAGPKGGSSRMMRAYELMVIIDGDVEDPKAQSWVKTVTDGITAAGGSIHGRPDWWGKRQFAYPINRKETGYYLVVEALAAGRRARRARARPCASRTRSSATS